jgi:WD40 repeat protein
MKLKTDKILSSQVSTILRRSDPQQHLKVNKIMPHSINIIENVNSVDAIDANPKNENEFVTGSHDKTIKIWDVAAGKSK